MPSSALLIGVSSSARARTAPPYRSGAPMALGKSPPSRSCREHPARGAPGPIRSVVPGVDDGDGRAVLAEGAGGDGALLQLLLDDGGGIGRVLRQVQGGGS